MYTKIKLEKLVADPKQPRQEFDPSELLRLKDSIRKYGIINPMIVEKTGDKFMLVDGERRYRAAKAIGMKEVPVLVVGNTTDTDRLAKRFHLQEQHVSWSMFDKARAAGVLIDKGMNNHQVAESLGIPSATVNDLLSILHLSKRTRTLAVEKRLPFSHLSALGKAIKKNTDTELNSKLESALLNKIESGLVTKYKDIEHYGTAIKYGGKKVLNKIINSKDFSPRQAMSEAKLDKKYLAMNMGYHARFLNSELRSAITSKVYDYAIGNTKVELQQTIKLAKKFVDEIPDSIE